MQRLIQCGRCSNHSQRPAPDPRVSATLLIFGEGWRRSIGCRALSRIARATPQGAGASRRNNR